jgi:protein phosphatase
MHTAISPRILDAYSQLLCLGSENVEEIGTKVPIPQFSEDALLRLCDAAIGRLSQQPINLEITGDIYIIGDVHGNLVDLLRCLYQMPRPPFSHLLFLGDYVDRGPFSIECVTLILTLLVQYPDCVFAIRGNHEFGAVNRVYGFFDEVMSVYKSEALWNRFQDVFAWMPFTAIVNRRFCCVHGGISQHLPRLSDLERYERPIYECEDPVIIDLVWSDPSTFYQLYGSSRRGIGSGYGPEASANFLRANRFSKIIRGHEYVLKGLEEAHGGLVVTVFSTSTGSDTGRNLVGLLKLTESNEHQPIILAPGPVLKRAETNFKPFVEMAKPSGPLRLSSSSQLLKKGTNVAKLRTESVLKITGTRSLGVEHILKTVFTLKEDA